MVHGKTGFTVTQKGGRGAYVLQVQTLMLEMHGAAANDLVDGDSACENRSVRRARQPTVGSHMKCGAILESLDGLRS